MVGLVARYRLADASRSGVRRAAAARKTSTTRKDRSVAADLDGIFNALLSSGPRCSRSVVRRMTWADYFSWTYQVH
jgi:hypothetical protein